MGQKKNKITKKTRQSVIKNITAQRIERKKTVQRVRFEHSYSQPNELKKETGNIEANERQLMEIDDTRGINSADLDLDMDMEKQQNIEINTNASGNDFEDQHEVDELSNGYFDQEINVCFDEDCGCDDACSIEEDCAFGEYCDSAIDCDSLVDYGFEEDSDFEDADAENNSNNIDEIQPENKTDADRLIQGRRIVDIMPFIEQLKDLNFHGGKENNCGFSEMMLVKEVKLGLKSIFHFNCRKCGITKQVHSSQHNPDSLDLNYASVLASYAIGTGYMQSEEYFANLEIPFMCSSTYDQHQKILQKDVKQCATEVEIKAVEEEKQEAIKRGDVDVNNVPLIGVGGDCGWSKRSYKTGYNANSGFASLVGQYTQKVLWHNIRNKRCKKCEKNSLTGKTDDHECNINYHGPPTGMEADIILEGFKKSESLYGVRYHRFIGDGDAKTYKALCDARIYMNPPLTIEKGECCQHIYRGSRGSLIKSKIETSKISQILKDIKCAVKHWSEQNIPFHTKVANLRKNIMCVPLHVFGNHEECDGYYCDRKNKGDEDQIPSMRKSGELHKIYHAIGRCIDNCKSLLKKYSNNRVEQFNGLVVKHTGGKRLDFTSAGSQEGRTNAAVISFNTSRLGSTMITYKLHLDEAILQSKEIYHLETRRINAVKNKKKLPFKKKKTYPPDENYGPTVEKILDPETFECRKIEFLEYLRDQQKNRLSLEKQTIGLLDCEPWTTLRCQVILSYALGRICNAKTAGGYKTIAEIVSCNRNFDTNIQRRYSANNAELAIKKLEDTEAVSVKECGLFLDEQIEFLGASPNGLIDEDGLVLVKCPYPARDMTIKEGISKGHIKLWSVSKNKTSKPEPKKLKTSQKKKPLRPGLNQKMIKPKKSAKANTAGKTSQISQLPFCVPELQSIDVPPKPTRTRKKQESTRTSSTRKNQLPSCEGDLPPIDIPPKPTRTRKMQESARTSSTRKNQLPSCEEDSIINKSCEWYYEAQGCLHVTNRNYCFIITCTNIDFKIQRIDKDDNFWKSTIEPKLVTFFNNELLPMIINKSRA